MRARSFWVPCILAWTLMSGAAAVNAQTLAPAAPKPLTIDPDKVTVLTGGQSEVITVNLRLPNQATSGTGKLVFRTLPPGVSTVPVAVTYQYQGAPVAIGAATTMAVKTTFRFAAPQGTQPGTYRITVADETFAVGSAIVELTVVARGDVGVAFGTTPLQLCGDAAVDDTVTLTPLSGYQGAPAVYWSSIPQGITVTPGRFAVSALSPAQTLPFKVQATGAAAGRYVLVLSVADAAQGISRTFDLSVVVGGCGDIAVAFGKTPLQLCGAVAVDDTVTLTPLSGYQGTPAVQWSSVPQGITVTPVRFGVSALPPAQTLPFKVQATGAAAGRYVLVLSVADANQGISRTLDLPVVVGGCGDIAVAFGKTPLQLCGAAAVDDTVTLTPLSGYQGTPAVQWSSVPQGITVTPVRFGVSALPPAQTLSFKVQATGAAAGRYVLVLSVADAAQGISKTFDLPVVVGGCGDVAVSFGRTPLQLCGTAAVDDTVTLTPLSGYQGAPAVYWSSIPQGITVTPGRFAVSALSPAQTLPFKVQATGAAAGRYVLVLSVADAAQGISRTFDLSVVVGGCGDIAVSFGKPVLSLCAGQGAVDDTVSLTPVGGYQGRPSVSWSNVPPGLTITLPELIPAALPPAQTLPFKVQATGALSGRYVLTLRVSDPAAGVEQKAELQIEVAASAFTPTVAPGSLVVQASGASRTVVATVDGNPCFAPPRLSVSVAGTPAGVTVTPATIDLTGPPYGQAQFTVAVSRQAVAGQTSTLTFTFQPTTGPPKSVAVSLLVTAAPDFELDVTPQATTVAAGDSVDAVVSARAVNGFAGLVTVTAPQLPGITFSPATFPLQLGGVVASGGVGRVQGGEASQGVTVSVDRKRPQGPVRASFSGIATSVPGPRMATMDLTVLPPRPTERVEGPRIDIIKPDTLEPGKQYDLELTGKNLTLDTRISLGSDITFLGRPFFTLPTMAKVTVLVAPTAAPGTRVAEASGAEGSNRGPGGVLIKVAPTRAVIKKPVCAKVTTLTYAKEKLQLELPKWGKQKIMENAWKDLGYPLIDDDALFQWREKSPGTAEYFELRIYDKASGTLLVTRRIGPETLKIGNATLAIVPRFFRPDPVFLAELLPKVSDKTKAYRAIGDMPTVPNVAGPGAFGPPAAQAAAFTQPQGPVSSQAAKVAAGKGSGGAQVAGKAGLGTQTPVIVMPTLPDPTAGADLLWEVAGFKLYDPTCLRVRAGQEVPKAEADGLIHLEVELSERWPLAVPNEPTGMDCPGGKHKTGSLQLDPLSDKTVLDENGKPVYDVVNGKKNPRIDPNNYPGDVFGLSGQFDLAYSPWATHPKATFVAPKGGQLATNISQLEFDTLFVDWGDGTVEPVSTVLPVQGKDPVMAWGRSVKLELPNPKGQAGGAGSFAHAIFGLGGQASGALRHSYDRIGTFTIRFFQLAEGDAQEVDPTQLGMAIDGPQLSPYLAALSFQGGGAASLLGGGKAPAGRTESSGKTADSTAKLGAQMTGALPAATLASWQQSTPAVLKRAYILYCQSLTITTREDTVATGPLHLDSIEVTGFPGHGKQKAILFQARDKAQGPMIMAPPPPPINVSDCDESLTATGVLRFYGKGKARITWKVFGPDSNQGIVVYTEDKEIGPSEQRKNLGKDPTTWGEPLLAEVKLDSDLLSVEKHGVHRVTVEAEVLPEFTPLDVEFASAVVADSVLGRQRSSGDLALAKKILTTGTNASKIGFLSPGQSGQGGAPAFASLQAAADTVLAGISLKKEKPLFVESEPRPYKVVGADPTTPCVFIFPTKLGEFRVSGLQGNVTIKETTFSGTGTLMLPLSKDSYSTKRHAVEVTFSNWEVPDMRLVEKGSLDVSPNRDIDGPGLVGTLSHVVGEAGASTELDATFDLTVKDTTLRINDALQKPPAWKGVTAPVTGAGAGLAEGSWYKAGLKLPEILIGWSAFKIRSDEVRLDWSRAEGDGAASQCGAGSGSSWVGVHLGTATLTPYTMDMVGDGGAYEKSVTDWGIMDAGLCGAITTGSWKASIGEGWVGFNAIHVTASGGKLSATYEGMKVHVPWPETEFGGDAKLQSGGGKSSGIGFAFIGSAPLVVYNDQPNRIAMKADNMFFTQEENVGWAVRCDTNVRPEGRE